MIFLHFEGTIVRMKKERNGQSSFTLTCELTKGNFNKVGQYVFGAVIYTAEKLLYGIVECERVDGKNYQCFHVNIHLVTPINSIEDEKIVLCTVMKIRQVRSFPSEEALLNQRKQDLLTLKERLSVDNKTLVHAPLLIIPDIIFSKFLTECFGINKGVYNTIDLWLWEKGIVSVEKRRSEIIQFLLEQRKDKTIKGKVKFGAGQLAKKLNQFWEENMYV